MESIYYRPWERKIPDEHSTVGTFTTEKEAKKATREAYSWKERNADGWKHGWKSHPNLLKLVARNDAGEDDTETFTVKIETVQQTKD